MQAQTAVVSGTLTGFDVVNDTGQPAHGFEIQLEGALPSDLYYTYNYSRYGVPTVVPYATGVYVRYQSTYDANTGQYGQTTPVYNASGFSWQNCYQGGAGYPTSGCEHLAQSMRFIPASQVITVTGRWMIDDVNNPGHLISADPAAAIPWATWLCHSSIYDWSCTGGCSRCYHPQTGESNRSIWRCALGEDFQNTYHTISWWR